MPSLEQIEDKVLSGGRISAAEAIFLSTFQGQAVMDLLPAANRIRRHFQDDVIDLCSIVNAKSGKCPEDCAYCAQSVRSTAVIPSHALLDKKTVMQKAADAMKGGAKRFCIVTSGRRVTDKELRTIADMVSSVRSLGLLPCATLGLLERAELEVLRGAGLERYHNNLETSERYFPEVCTTHSYREKIRTIRAADAAGLSVCSGGIFGLGETWEDRIAMALVLAELDVDSVPINFLSPIKGTKLGGSNPLAPLEALKIISIYRFILPDKQIRVCGGRLQILGEFNALIFLAGASGLLIGNYLTTLGRSYEADIMLIKQSGLHCS